MHVIFADSIDGGIEAILIVFGGLAISALALCALVPAWLGNLVLTFTLAVPALICGLAVTLYFAWGYLKDGLNDPSYELRDFMLPWVFMAGPALTTSSLALFVLWLKRRGMKPSRLTATPPEEVKNAPE
jgi:hypothetical protein